MHRRYTTKINKYNNKHLRLMLDEPVFADKTTERKRNVFKRYPVLYIIVIKEKRRDNACVEMYLFVP